MLAIRVLSFTNSAGRNASRLCWTRFQQRFMSSPATALYSSKLILTPSELATLKAGKDSNVVPIDVSWFMPNVERDAQAEFLIRRIPTARRMDLDVVASEHPLGLKHMMPSGAVFAEACGKLPYISPPLSLTAWQRPLECPHPPTLYCEQTNSGPDLKLTHYEPDTIVSACSPHLEPSSCSRYVNNVATRVQTQTSFCRLLGTSKPRFSMAGSQDGSLKDIL